MIELERVSKAFGEKAVLREITLSLPREGRYALMGPSGCGKTTLLRLIAGLEAPDSGRITRPERIAFCFQEDRLLPWYSIRENVALALDLPRSQALACAQEWLARVGLGGDGDALPAQLSGGMKRRASLARALAYDAPVLLMDEPFRALDEASHAAMLQLVVRHAQGRLLLLATHDPADAAGMNVIRL